jgi:uncharacterized protein YcbX
MTAPTLERILVYPVKSLDAHEGLEEVPIRANGGLSHDRAFAIVDADGEYVNGKREPRVHGLCSRFDLDAGRVTLRAPDGEPRAFDLDDRDDMAAWLSDYFDRPVAVRRDDRGGFPDDTRASGPTVIAEATIEAVAGWFDGVDAAEMARRLRPNLVVSGVEPFWEDRLYADRETAVAFRIGDCEFLGSNPCQRCVVPARDPDTGEPTPGFRERFVRKRRETLPDWADPAWFDHHFRLMVNTFVPDSTAGTRLQIGEEVEILGERPRPS